MHAPYVSPDLLQRAARAARYPAVTVAAIGANGLSIVDRGAWTHVLLRAVASDRVALLLALEPHLLEATPQGNTRLRRARTGRQAPFYTPPEVLDTDPVVVGDEELWPIVQQAFALLPLEVAAAAREEIAFLGVGRSSAAWRGCARFTGRDGHERHQVVVVGPRASLRTILHEIGHAWHAPLAPRTVEEKRSQLTITVEGEAGLRELLPEQYAAHVAQSEALADALAECWLLKPTAGRPS